MQRYRFIIDFIIPCALLVFLITSNVRFVAGSQLIHTQLFERYDVSEQSGITPADLYQVSHTIEVYFAASSDAKLEVTTAVFGYNQPLFTDAEISHMADVKELFSKIYTLQLGLIAVLVLTAVLFLKFSNRPFAFSLTLWFRRSVVLGSFTILIVGGLSLIAFDPLFTIFHRLGFPQGNWLFDPRTDFLVKIFPFGFWRDATLIIGALTIVELALLTMLSIGLHRLPKRTSR
jgi:integral membrane protein (TIGR01906 family)